MYVHFIFLATNTGVEGYGENLEARRVRNAENRDDVEGVSSYIRTCVAVSYGTV